MVWKVYGNVVTVCLGQAARKAPELCNTTLGFVQKSCFLCFFVWKLISSLLRVWVSNRTEPKCQQNLTKRRFWLFWNIEPPKSDRILFSFWFTAISNNNTHWTDPKPNPYTKPNSGPNSKPNTYPNLKFDTVTKTRQKTINFFWFYSPCQPRSLESAPNSQPSLTKFCFPFEIGSADDVDVNVDDILAGFGNELAEDLLAICLLDLEDAPEKSETVQLLPQVRSAAWYHRRLHHLHAEGNKIRVFIWWFRDTQVSLQIVL